MHSHIFTVLRWNFVQRRPEDLMEPQTRVPTSTPLQVTLAHAFPKTDPEMPLCGSNRNRACRKMDLRTRPLFRVWETKRNLAKDRETKNHALRYPSLLSFGAVKCKIQSNQILSCPLTSSSTGGSRLIHNPNMDFSEFSDNLKSNRNCTPASAMLICLLNSKFGKFERILLGITFWDYPGGNCILWWSSVFSSTITGSLLFFHYQQKTGLIYNLRQLA